MKQLSIPFPVLFLFLICCTLTSAQGPAAAPTTAPALPAPPITAPALPAPTIAAPATSPAPAGPANVIAILRKDGRFSVFIRLLQSTKVADNLNSQLIDDSNSGLTVFAPTDSAFSGLKSGMLNSLTDEQKVELMQFHVLPFHLAPSQFQTASNPLRTQAGSTADLFPLNVTAIGGSVNITTGETNTSVANTIYNDDQLAVYEVGKVLLPMRFYVPLPPPPPSPPPPPKKAAPKAPAYVAPVDSADCLSKQVLHAMVCVMLVLVAFP